MLTTTTVEASPAVVVAALRATGPAARVAAEEASRLVAVAVLHVAAAVPRLLTLESHHRTTTLRLPDMIVPLGSDIWSVPAKILKSPSGSP